MIIPEKELLSIVSQEPLMVLVMQKEYVTNNVWQRALELEPRIFHYIQDPSEEVIYMALREDGTNITHAIENHYILSSRCIEAAISNYPAAILDLPRLLQTDDIKEMAFDLEPSLIKEFNYIRKDYIEAKLIKDPTFARYLKHPSEEQLLNALKVDISFSTYIETFTPEMKKYVKEMYPQLVPLLPQMKDSEVKICL